MSLSPIGRVLVKVVGARGALGIDLDTPATPGQYLVKAAGSDSRKYLGSTPAGTIADAVKATDLAGTTGAQRVGVGTRSLDDKLGEIVSVKDTKFAGGAKGNGTAIDRAAIQAAIDYLDSKGGGTLIYPAGTYLTNAPIVPKDRIIHVGVGGHVGSLIVGNHGGDIFQASKLEFGTFYRLAFTGSGCTGIRQSGNPKVDYFSDFKVTECHFYGDLAEGINVNPIRSKIEGNSSGYYGNVGTSHRFLAAIGISTNLANINKLSGNLIYHGKGSECVLLENGSGWSIDGMNNFEKNQTLPIRVRGIVALKIEDNFFEDNSGTEYEIEINIGSAVSNLSGLQIDRNQFVRNPSVNRYVQINTTNFDDEGWTFDGNKNLNALTTNDYTHLANQVGTAQLVDVSGAGIALQDGSAAFVRRVSENRIVVSVKYPAGVTNTQPAIIGGLPFPSKKIEGASVQSDVVGGVSLLTDSGNSSFSLYKGSSLTRITNAELAGKTLYINFYYTV